MSAIIDCYSYLREINIISMALRMLLAMLCGGIIGMEREYKRRPAGFRTYMLVCLGATTTMLLSQYEDMMLSTRWADIAALVGIKTDVSRFGAQVINGIGFLGAGTIIVTGKQEIKGMTTAAGLWASACMGLAIGAGFYECTIIGFILIFISVKFFPAIEDRLNLKARNINIYIEFDSLHDVGGIVGQFKQMNVQIYEIELDKRRHKDVVGALLTLKLAVKQDHHQFIYKLAELPCVRSIEEV